MKFSKFEDVKFAHDRYPLIHPNGTIVKGNTNCFTKQVMIIKYIQFYT